MLLKVTFALQPETDYYWHNGEEKVCNFIVMFVNNSELFCVGDVEQVQ